MLFLDTNHVEVDGSHTHPQAAGRRARPADRPGRSRRRDDARRCRHATSPSRARRRRSRASLTRYWHWGERDRRELQRSGRERVYGVCYPGAASADPTRTRKDQNGIAAGDDRSPPRKADARRAAGSGRVTCAACARSARRSRDHRRLAAVSARTGPRAAARVPRRAALARCDVDPRTGRLTTKDPPNAAGGTPRELRARSDARSRELDDDTQFRDMLDEANRANASFYPIDPRGLAVFDEPIVPTAGVRTRRRRSTPAVVEQATRAARRGSTRCARSPKPPTASRSSTRTTRGRLQARRRRPELVLPARLLLDAASSMEGSTRSGPREASGRRGARAARLSGGDAGCRCRARPAEGSRGGRAWRAETPSATRRVAAAVGPLPPATRATCRCACSRGRLEAGGERRQRGQPQVGDLDGRRGGRPHAWKRFDATSLTHAGGSVGRRADASRQGAVSAAHSDRCDRVAARGGRLLVRVRSQTPGGVEPLTVRRHDCRPQRQRPARSSCAAGRPRETRNCRPPTCGSAGASSCASRCRQRPHGVTARLLDRTGKPFPVPVASAMRDDADGSRWATRRSRARAAGAGRLCDRESSADSTRTLVPFRLVPVKVQGSAFSVQGSIARRRRRSSASTV